METLIAYCGLSCDRCPIHLATLEKDKSQQRFMRESIAEQCRKSYGMNLDPDDITACDGCSARYGRLFSGCLNCLIRQCAIRKNIESCAICYEYICEHLETHFSSDPEARDRLEEIRRSLKI